MVRVLVWGTRGRRFESCLPDSQPITLQCSRFHRIAVDSKLRGYILRGLVLRAQGAGPL